MQLFISYAHVDKIEVKRLVDILQQQGHQAWFDEQLGTGRWQEQLRAAIRSADVFIYILAPASIASEWCQWEFVTAIELSKPIIPVLLKLTKIPVVLEEYQHVDFTQNNVAEAIQKLNVMLTTLNIVIPQEKAPNKPNKPHGMPEGAKSVSQTVAFGDVSGGQVHIQQVGTQINNQLRGWRIGLILIVFLMVALVGIILVGLLPETKRNMMLHIVGLIPASVIPTTTPTASLTPTITPTPTPTRLPANTNMLNIAILGFGLKQDNGSVTQDDDADTLSDLVTSQIASFPNVEVVTWRSNGVGRLLVSNKAERDQQAAHLADMLGVDLIIYGVVTKQGVYGTLEPEFYISDQFATLEPGLIGSESLGTPVKYLLGSKTPNADLNKKFQVIRLFLQGLEQYILGAYEDAHQTFDSAAKLEPHLEVMKVFAGNAAIREQIPNLEGALALYDGALADRPDYSRALIGRGITIFQMAFDTEGSQSVPSTYDPSLKVTQRCNNLNTPLPTRSQLLAELAIRCYEEAAISLDIPNDADIDVKAAFGLAQTYTWLSDRLHATLWDQTDKYCQQMLQLYNASDLPRQARIVMLVSQAYAYLGQKIITTEDHTPANLQQAIVYYQQAISLLNQDDLGKSYNIPIIDSYRKITQQLQQEIVSTITPTPTRILNSF